jgi:acetyl esterase/lipase
MKPDLVYADHGGRTVRLDRYDPPGSLACRTAVLVLHGGGWRAGDRKMIQPTCEALASRGFTALAVEYRLLGEVAWPAQLDDVRAALTWTHEHASELGVDTDKIVLQGHSAGAQLALVTAGNLSTDGNAGSVAAVVAYYPPIRFADRPLPDLAAVPDPRALAAIRADDGSVPAAMLLEEGASAAEMAAASPITYARAGFPPTMLFQGTSDLLVGTGGAFEFMRALHEAEVASEVHYCAGGDHAFDVTPFYTRACVAAVEAFLYRHVVDPRAAVEEIRRTNFMAAMSESPS